MQPRLDGSTTELEVGEGDDALPAPARQVPTFDEAIQLAQRLLDPVLAGPVVAV